MGISMVGTYLGSCKGHNTPEQEILASQLKNHGIGGFYWCYQDRIQYLVAHFPDGAGIRWIPAVDHNKGEGGWRWNEDLKKPTLEPSLRMRDINDNVAWHGYIRSGNMESC